VGAVQPRSETLGFRRSLQAFLLIGGGLTMLLGFGTRRGAGLLSATICVLLVVLSIWGYVVATHGVMRSAVAQGGQNVSVGAGGGPQHPCQG
jgi:hypothetical protein